MECYVLATSAGISRWAPTCDSAHSWQIHSAANAILGNQATGTMTQYPTQSQYPDTELPSPCPMLLMSSARLGYEKFKFYESLVRFDWELNS